MLELLLLAVAGLLGGAALGSRKNGAPVALTWILVLLTVVALALAVGMLVNGSGT